MIIVAFSGHTRVEARRVIPAGFCADRGVISCAWRSEVGILCDVFRVRVKESFITEQSAQERY